MIAKNKTIQKLVSSLIIVSMLVPAILFSFQPKKAEAQWVVFDPVHTAVTVKIVVQEILRQFLMTVTRKLLNKMTQNMVNWVNEGFHGNPLYLENPQSFFKDIAKSEVKTLVNTFGYDNLKYPFGKQFAINTINSYNQRLEDNASYTLSKVTNDPVLLNNYRNDFSVGGWNGFLVNTQYPQNNYVGFNMIASEKLAKQLNGTEQTAANKVKDTIAQAGGFLAPQVCQTNANYNNMKNEFQQPEWNETAYDETNVPPNPVNYGFGEAVGGSDGWPTPEAQAEYEQAKAKWEGDRIDAKDNWEADNDCPPRANGSSGFVTTTPGAVVGTQIGSALGSKLHSAELGAALGNSLSAIFDALINKFMQVGLSSLSDKTPPPDEGPATLDDFYYGGQSVNTAGDTPDVVIPQNPPIDVNVINDSNHPIPVTITGLPADTGKECVAPLTDSQKQYIQASVDYIIPLLEAIPKMNPIVTPAPDEYQAAVQSVIADTNAKFPDTGSNPFYSYYPKENDIAGRFNYIVGPATITVSNIIPIGDTWRNTFRVTCDGTEGSNGSSGSTGSNVGGTSTNGGGASANPTPGLPYIKSVSPATANGGETMTITGFDLSSTVKFSSNLNGKAQTIGGANVSSDKTRVTVTVPTGMTPGATSVQDILSTDSTKASNSVIITIGGGVTGDGSISATVPSVGTVSGNRGGLAFNPTNNSWLVVGALDSITGMVVGNDTSVIKPEFKINTDSGLQVLGPKVAFAPNLNKYLVVWIGFPVKDAARGIIWGRFINPDGSFSGAPFPVFSDSDGASFLQPNGTLQYDSVNQKFVFAWEYRNGDRASDVNVELVTINKDGNLGGMIQIPKNANGGNWSPSISINEMGNEYCVAYDQRNTGRLGLTKINATTMAVSPETSLSITPAPVDTNIAYNSFNKQYLVGWNQFGVGKTQGMILNSCNLGSVAKSAFTLNAFGGAPSVTYNPVSKEYAVIVQDQNDFGNKYNIISSTGAILSSGVAFGAGARDNGNYAPIMIPNTVDGSFGAISALNYARTFFAPNIK